MLQLQFDAFAEVTAGETPESVMLTVDVGEAKKGSGTAEIADADTVVAPGATGETITFTYTAVGEISYPREFRVRVPTGWSAPSNAGHRLTMLEPTPLSTSVTVSLWGTES